MRDRHDLMCTIDGREWRVSLDSVCRGNGCPDCSRRSVHKHTSIKTATLERYLDELAQRNIKLLSTFTRVHNKHDFLCLVVGCNHPWNAEFSSVRRGSGCPKCAGNWVDIDAVIKEINSRGIQVLEPYKNMNTKTLFRCDVCERNWRALFNLVRRGSGCPKCAGFIITDDERVTSLARKILRMRLTKLFILGKTNKKVYENEDGTYNELYNQLFSHWENEYKLIPPKPVTGDIWNLDHIIPLSWFNPYSIEEMKLCWSAANCRWLTQTENYARHNRMRGKDLEVLTDWHYAAIAKCSYPGRMPIAVSVQVESSNAFKIAS